MIPDDFLACERRYETKFMVGILAVLLIACALALHLESSKRINALEKRVDALETRMRTE